MLRITTVEQPPSQVILKLTGRIVADWVTLLEEYCLSWLQKGKKVLLDCAEVTFIDARGVEMLQRIESDNLRLLNCSAFIHSLLREGRKS